MSKQRYEGRINVSNLTNTERKILAHEAGEWLTVAEASAINKLMDALRPGKLKTFVAETICEATDWYQDAHEEHLDATGATLVRCANIATGKGA